MIYSKTITGDDERCLGLKATSVKLTSQELLDQAVARFLAGCRADCLAAKRNAASAKVTAMAEGELDAFLAGS